MGTSRCMCVRIAFNGVCKDGVLWTTEDVDFFLFLFLLHIWKDVTMYFAYAIHMPKELVRLSSSKAWKDDGGVQPPYT